MTTSKPRHPRPTPGQRLFARRMRAAMTPAEKRLWWALRHRIELKGTHFRRQTPIGPYIADFCCLGCRLVIEADGGQHYSGEAEHRDAERSRVLAAHGFEVLRFGNTSILTDIETVIATIHAAMNRKLGGIPAERTRK